MKKARRLVLAALLAGAPACVSQRGPEETVSVEARATVPERDAALRAAEEAEARERRRAFVESELRFAIEHAAPHAAPERP